MSRPHRLSPIQFETYYHGTNPANVESIKKHGLKMNNPAAGLYDNEEDENDPGHPTGVYLSSNINTAEDYGDAIFAVELPNKGTNWLWTESDGEVVGSDIPPEMLKQVK